MWQQDPSLLNFSAQAQTSDELIQQAYQNHQSDVQVKGKGTVIKILSDDLKGSRHQRFILRLNNGQTLLVAHNIDLAPRLNGLSKNQNVEFYGEYEWNNKGGILHWTHRDPAGRHKHGWLKYNGRTYQ
ncbi:MAG: DUF3465 domain-containing protein [Candidatus Brocadiaceae bacterium]|nr:DUF3465 domain-containing protein [Candidatus Brocadiaceae bacterium]